MAKIVTSEPQHGTLKRNIEVIERAVVTINSYRRQHHHQERTHNDFNRYESSANIIELAQQQWHLPSEPIWLCHRNKVAIFSSTVKEIAPCSCLSSSKFVSHILLIHLFCAFFKMNRLFCHSFDITIFEWLCINKMKPGMLPCPSPLVILPAW